MNTQFLCPAPLQRSQFKCPLKGTAHQTISEKEVWWPQAPGYARQPRQKVHPFLSLLTYFTSNILCFPLLFPTGSVAGQPQSPVLPDHRQGRAHQCWAPCWVPRHFTGLSSHQSKSSCLQICFPEYSLHCTVRGRECPTKSRIALKPEMWLFFFFFPSGFDFFAL